jgi:hypothetical protein
MELIYFTGRETSAYDPLLRAMQSLAPARGLWASPAIDEFSRKIAQSPARHVLAVMKPCDEEALIDIYFTRCLFRRIPSILVLPNRERHTSALAFRIGPTRVFPFGTNHRKIAAAVSAFLNEWQKNTISGPDKYSAAA